MQIQVYTEEAYNATEQVCCCDLGDCHCPIRITPDKVVEVLKRAELPGNGQETYIVVPE